MIICTAEVERHTAQRRGARKSAPFCPLILSPARGTRSLQTFSERRHTYGVTGDAPASAVITHDICMDWTAGML